MVRTTWGARASARAKGIVVPDVMPHEDAPAGAGAGPDPLGGEGWG